MWEVLADSGQRTPCKRVVYVCRCLCGREKLVISSNLRSGGSKGCGCTRKSKKALKTKHPLYYCYQDMKSRCLRKSHPSYKDYGGRGINICDRWLKSFWDFVEDLGDRPIGKSLDRIDNDLGYSPENCKWSTPKEQVDNRRPYRPRSKV